MMRFGESLREELFKSQQQSGLKHRPSARSSVKFMKILIDNVTGSGKSTSHTCNKIMPQITDPAQAMKSFQEVLKAEGLPLHQGEIDPNIYLHKDNPNGKLRFSYVTLDGLTVTAFVSFVVCNPIEGIPCFNIGYAVPEKYRNQGRAKRIIRSAIIEMKNGISRAGIPTFYIEAIIGKNNQPSKRVAEQIISNQAQEITDQVSGLPALQYLCKI